MELLESGRTIESRAAAKSSEALPVKSILRPSPSDRSQAGSRAVTMPVTRPRYDHGISDPVEAQEPSLEFRVLIDRATVVPDERDDFMVRTIRRPIQSDRSSSEFSVESIFWRPGVTLRA
jgi:hypothetical protein